MKPVGLANTRISTNGYAEKPPQSLYMNYLTQRDRKHFTVQRYSTALNVVLETCCLLNQDKVGSTNEAHEQNQLSYSHVTWTCLISIIQYTKAR